MAGMEDVYARRPDQVRIGSDRNAPGNRSNSFRQYPSTPSPGFYEKIGQAGAGCKPLQPGDPSSRLIRDPVSSSDGPLEESERYAGASFGVVGLLAETLFAHPFVVLRRQCQVNNTSMRFHRTPFSLVPILVNLNRSQGFSVLWKGLGSSLTIRGLSLAVEDCTSKFTPWPKEIDRDSSLKMIGQHLLLKATSVAILTPFISSSLVETVQSDIASEHPGIFDVFREGFNRICFWSSPHSSRIIPIWALIPYTVTFGTSYYIIYVIGKGLSNTLIARVHKQRQIQQGAVLKTNSCSMPGLIQYQEQMATLIGNVLASTLLFPFETILHRLHLQGCRTIVDNLDNGKEVIPIMTRYEGFFDCFSTVVYEEGFSGLFKGFGAMVLQFTVHYAIIRFSASVLREISRHLNGEVDPALLILDDQKLLPKTSGASSGTVQSEKSVDVEEKYDVQNMQQFRRFDDSLSEQRVTTGPLTSQENSPLRSGSSMK